MKQLPTSLSRVDYASLATSFVTGIENVLRGFQTPGSEEWLDMWVLDEDPVRSILNIFEAAEIAALPGVTVWLDSETLEGIEVSKLEEALARLGTLEMEPKDEGLNVTLVFGAPSASEADAAPVAATPVVRRVATPSAPIERCDDLGPYEAAIAKVLESVTHEGEPTPADGEVLVQATLEGVTLAVRVDAERRITHATHQGTRDDTSRALFEALCALMKGRTAQDCGDHATQYVHAKLRARSVRRAVPGVAMSHNSHPAFEPVETLVRMVIAKYRSHTGTKLTPNFEHAGPGDAWRSQDDAGRKASIQKVLDASCADLNLPSGTCIQASPGGSVAMSFGELIPSKEGRKLLELERVIKSEVDSAIYIHIEAIKDENKLRNLGDR